jgi:hypothetical protein
MDEMESLRKRVNQLEDDLSGLIGYIGRMATANKSRDEAMRRDVLYTRAEIGSVCTLLQEIAAREGITTEQFNGNYMTRTRFYHQFELSAIEKSSPELAAKLDCRPLCFDIPEDYAPLFVAK